MLISVVIPCYNVANYITECLSSIAAQSHQPMEIICVDNNSTDNTFELLNGWNATHNLKITVLQETQKGAPAARNKGLSVAQGEYIQFLDADDLLLPDKIKKQVELIKLHQQPDFIVADYYRQNTKGDKKLHQVKTDDVWLGLLNTQLGITSANLFKTATVKKVGGFTADLQSSQEYDLMFKILKNGGAQIHDNSALVTIRDRETGSISLQNKEQNLLRYLALRKKIVAHLKTKFQGEAMKPYYQSLFDTIRTLYQVNKKEALIAFKAEIPKGFVPLPSAATTSLYILFYKIFGFTGAEKIKSILK
jgi:glycosyltransferase involved in cell wall biosynthesis